MTREPDPFEGLRPVTPPTELRASTLSAAREALATAAEPRDVWTRIAQSLVLRVAWVAAVVVFVLGHVTLSLPDRRIAPPTEVTPSLASGTEPEVIELVRMAAIDSSARPPSAARKENGS